MSQPLSQLLCCPRWSNHAFSLFKHSLRFDCWEHISREILHAYVNADRNAAQIDLFWGLELTIAPPSVCSYSHCRVSPPTWSRNTSLVFFFCLWALSSAWPWRPVGGESMCFVKRIYDLWVFSRWFSSAAARDDPWPGLCSSGLRMNGVTESVGLLLVAKAQVRKIRL